MLTEQIETCSIAKLLAAILNSLVVCGMSCIYPLIMSYTVVQTSVSLFGNWHTQIELKDENSKNVHHNIIMLILQQWTAHDQITDHVAMGVNKVMTCKQQTI